MLITVLPNGVSAGVPPSRNDHERAKRGEIVEWSRAAVRRHTRWLYSVQSDDLTGDGYAVTLTVRDCPPTHEHWTRLLAAWFMRAERAGAVRIHYVVEWQRRGYPHLHAAVYFPDGFRDQASATRTLLGGWVELASEYGARHGSQTCKPIDGALGWLQYLSKHASRGVAHYQRAGRPEGWEKTGKLWGHRGEWPVGEPVQFSCEIQTFWAYRRMVRKWRRADARAALAVLQAKAAHGGSADYSSALRAARRRVAAARGCLRCGEKRLSAVRGVSDWVPLDVSVAMMVELRDLGHRFMQRERFPDRETDDLGVTIPTPGVA